ncbi:MAG: hypothetical protein AAF799_02405 [Myxococcota bacterium]
MGSTSGAAESTGAPDPTPPVPSAGTTGATTAVDTSGGGFDTGGGSDDGLTTAGFLCNSGDDDPWHCSSDGGGFQFECDMFVQDCPKGETCMPWANDGGAVWNSTRCAPLPPTPDAIGETCTVEGSGVSGIDSCELGSVCWNVDPTTNFGECVAVCGGDESSPTCADGDHCRLSNEGAIILCLPTCNPLAAECDDGQVCVPDYGGLWTCVPGVSTPFEAGQPCDFDNVCEAGSICVDAELSDACVGNEGCCAALCDLEFPTCDDPAATCVPWYAPEQDPPGLGGTGICTVDVPTPAGGWELPLPSLTYDPA